MKTTALFLSTSIAICAFLTSCGDTQTCDHATRISCDFYLDIPAGFTGEMTQGVYPNRTATVTAQKCEGPFEITLTNADGTVEPVKTYSRGEATVDTSYIEQPEPPYELKMVVETVYRAKEVE
jgi:hypothetical protein